MRNIHCYVNCLGMDYHEAVIIIAALQKFHRAATVRPEFAPAKAVIWCHEQLMNVQLG
jgi:hypothetical protein